MFRFALLVGFSTVVGCGGGPCEGRSGVYLVEYKTISGSCGELAAHTVTLSAQPTKPTKPCTGSIKYSADNCEVTTAVDCPLKDEPGAKLTTSGKASWSADGRTGTAMLDFVQTGSNACHGNYDATYTKN